MSTARIEAFSDGVIAIVITILVLEIKVPEVSGGLQSGELLAEALIKTIPKFTSYVVSFIVITVWWVTHHQLFHMIEKSDRGLLWMNSFFLMWLAFLPFPTALIGEYPDEKLPVMIYGIVAMITGVSFLMMRAYATYKGRLIKDIPRQRTKRDLIGAAMNPILYAIATVIGYFRPGLAILLFGLVPLYFFIPSPLERGE